MLEKGLHVGNLTAAFAVIATTAADMTLAGGAATLFRAALSGTALFKGRDQKDAKAIAKDLHAVIGNSHLTKAQDTWLRQMLAAYPPKDADFPAADMDGGKLAQRLIDRIKASAKDPEHRSAAALDAYGRVMPVVFQNAIDRAEDLFGAVKELLARSEHSGDTHRLRDEGITEKAIIRLAQRIVADTDEVGQPWLELQNAMDIAVRVQADGAVQSNHGDFVDTVLARVADLAKDGEYKTASAEIDDALDQAHAQIARLFDSGVEVALLDRDTAKAAALLIRKADLAAGGVAEFETLRALRSHYYVLGRDKGSNLDSQLAIDLAQAVLVRGQTPDQNGTAGNDLGNAMQTLGAREGGTERLDQAVTAYTEALKENTRDRVPMDWARTQMNLGAALQTLGAREGGTEHLDQAVTAFTEALKENTRDRVPMDWALTRHCQAGLALAFFDKTGDPAQLDTAYDHAMAAREVYVAAKADYYINWIDEHQLAAIKTRRDAL